METSGGAAEPLSNVSLAQRAYRIRRNALRMGEVRDHAVVRPGARERRVTIARVVGQQQVIGKVQEAEMPPEARVVLLCMQEHAFAARGIRVRPEVLDVRNALFLVDDQVLHHVEVFGRGLREHSPGRVVVVTSVVHVHVQVRPCELAE